MKFDVTITLPGNQFAALAGLLATEDSACALRELIVETKASRGEAIALEMGIAAINMKKTIESAMDTVYARLGTISEGENIHV